MNHSRVSSILVTVLFIVSTTSLFGQKFEPKKRLLDPDTTISSKIMGRDYELYISFPRNYSTKDTVKYPVLYVLDGRHTFPIVKSARETMDWAGELERVIIVAIGSGLDQASWHVNRMYDYTTSKDTATDRSGEKRMGVPKGTIQSGGAEKFLQCITTEIIPYIDAHYKTTKDRGITGHSLGGLFTAYCFLNSKGIFTRFGLNSPSLWWNNSELMNQAESQFSKNETWGIPATKVFVSVGQKEGPQMVPLMIKFSTMLEAKSYKNVSLTWNIFQEETHLSVLPDCLSRTLTVLYGIKK
jgi:uncharacterized protein